MLDKSIYEIMGGKQVVFDLTKRFYDHMEIHEPALAKLHELDDDGNISAGARERFAVFLVSWFGGPQDYLRLYGHPRLRMRHMHLPVDTAMRDAWMRSMMHAMDSCDLPEEVRAYLDARFFQVADFMRNRQDPE